MGVRDPLHLDRRRFVKETAGRSTSNVFESFVTEANAVMSVLIPGRVSTDTRQRPCFRADGRRLRLKALDTAVEFPRR
jgi:hypothetical protein